MKFNELKEEKATSLLDLGTLPDEISIEPIIEKQLKKDDENTQKFDTDEHIAIGDTAFELFLEQLSELEGEEEINKLLVLTEKEGKLFNRKTGKHEKTTLYQIPVTQDLALTAGEIVALAGDFFGVPNHPISFGNPEAIKKEKEEVNLPQESAKQTNHFIQAYATLTDTTHRHQIDTIIAYVKDQAQNHEDDEPLVFKKDGSVKSNAQFIQMSEDSGLPCSLKNNRYIQLALKNFDHFGEDALQAFLSGHRQAIDCAKAAATAKDSQTKGKLFRQAIGMSLFACHYLTDLYASGHMRTPRRAILNALLGLPLDAQPNLESISFAKLFLAGLLAKKMHDEECKAGLEVESEVLKQSWRAFGDGAYYKPDNNKNAKYAAQAVAAVLMEVVHAYQGHLNEVKLTDKAYLAAYLPKPKAQISNESNNNNSLTFFKPLYTVDKTHGQVLCRDTNQPLEKLSLFSIVKTFYNVSVKRNTTTQVLTTEKEAEALLTTLDNPQVSCTIS